MSYESDCGEQADLAGCPNCGESGDCDDCLRAAADFAEYKAKMAPEGFDDCPF